MENRLIATPRLKSRKVFRSFGKEVKVVPFEGQTNTMSVRNSYGSPQTNLTGKRRTSVGDSMPNPVAQTPSSKKKLAKLYETTSQPGTPLSNYKTKNLSCNLRLYNLVNENNYNLIKEPNVSFSCSTKIGKFAGKPKPNNQDSFKCISNFAQNHSSYFFGVFDGHGHFGHKVSELVKDKFPCHVASCFPKNSLFHKIDLDDSASIKKALRRGCEKTCEDLNLSDINTQFSGSTLITVVVVANKIYCCNIGDSRAVLGRKIGTNWVAIPLSKDHKPNNPSEKSRIESSGGQVRPFKDPSGRIVGPPRIWVRKTNYPGLALSRSLGDSACKKIGVTADPEIKDFKLMPEDKFIVIASDGLWEFMSNHEVVQIVSKAWESQNINFGVNSLMKKACLEWKRVSKARDDITIIIVFLCDSG